jgi:UDPglucose 6-dehydrogenase
MKLGIIGNGFVGQATSILECENNELFIYDLVPEKCKPLGLKLEDLSQCDFIFICVPTPSTREGKCDTRIVESAINSVKSVNQNIIVRSTVPMGFCKRFDCIFMPEFLTEKNWRNDFYECPRWIFGCDKNDKIIEMINNAYHAGKIRYNHCYFTSSTEAEMIKYTRNNFLALKISFFNEIFDICEATGCSYSSVIDGVTCDPRIGESHTKIGLDGHRGFGGTCLPKDTNALKYFMENELQLKSYIIDAMCRRNVEIDRPERDWENDPRAFSN